MEKKKHLHTGLVFLEICILCFGIFLSFGTTLRVVAYDTKYAVYYVFSVLGILMVAGLIYSLAKKNRFTVLIGLVCINVYLISAGYACMVCTLNMQRMRRLANLETSKVIATVDGKTYEWDGERVSYEGHKMTLLEKKDSDKVYVDGEERMYTIYRGEKEHTVYICIYTGATGDFLELHEVP